jgi:DNA primase
LYDGDPAGIKAALRGTDIILENNLNVRIVVFPEGEDPDSYCKKVGGTAFEEYIKANQTDFIIFKTRHLLGESEGDPIKKATVIREVVESIVKIPDPIKRSVFIKATATMLDTDEQVLIAETNRLRLKGNEKAFKQIEQEYENLFIHEDGISEKNINIQESREKAIVKSLILFGNLQFGDGSLVAKFILTEIELEGLEFNNIHYNDMVIATKSYFDENGFVDEYFFKNNEKTTKLAADIIIDSQKHLLSERWETDAEKIIKKEIDNYEMEVEYNIDYLKYSNANKWLRINSEKLKFTDDPDEQKTLLEIQMEILKKRNELAEKLKITIH